MNSPSIVSQSRKSTPNLKEKEVIENKTTN